jgi:hypothetical protein
MTEPYDYRLKFNDVTEALMDIRHELSTMNLLLASYIHYAGVTAKAGVEATDDPQGTLDKLREAAHTLMQDVERTMERAAEYEDSE